MNYILISRRIDFLVTRMLTGVAICLSSVPRRTRRVFQNPQAPGPPHPSSSLPQGPRFLNSNQSHRGKVAKIVEGATNDEIAVSFPGGKEVVAVITKGSTKRLALAEGRDVLALIKASFVILLDDADGYVFSTRNVYAGKVDKVARGQVAVEVVVDCNGLEMTSTITVPSADRLALKEGALVTCAVKATTIVLAVKKKFQKSVKFTGRRGRRPGAFAHGRPEHGRRTHPARPSGVCRKSPGLPQCKDKASFALRRAPFLRPAGRASRGSGEKAFAILYPKMGEGKRAGL